MKALKHQKAYGYHRLETNDEILARLNISLSAIDITITIDQWLERLGYTRKMIYVP